MQRDHFKSKCFVHACSASTHPLPKVREILINYALGVIQVLPNADVGGGGGSIFRKKHYEGVRFNVISVTRGWVGVQFPEKSVM